MGGLFAKPNVLKVDIVNDAINNSILNISTTTSDNTSVSQYMESSEAPIIGSTQSVDITSTTSSILNAVQSSDFDEKFNTAVTQELDSKTVALLGAFDSLLQNRNVDMRTNIKNSLSNLNLSEITQICVSNKDISQSMIAGKYKIENSQQIMKGTFVTNCATNVTHNVKSVSDMTNSINQRAKISSENPLNFIGDVLKHFAYVILFIMLAIIGGFVIMIGPGKLDANALVKDAAQITTSASKVATLGIF